jgi:DNA-directed RNA polymerase subunit RPC12/RpoP
VSDSGPHSERSWISAYDWRHPLVWIALISFGGAVVGLIASAFQPTVAITFLSSLLTLIASSLISHLITYSSERRQFSRHLAKFSAFAKRRVNILCTDLNLLSIEIEVTPDLKEAKRIVQYALKNLEQDARASVRDIEEMRRIDEDDKDEELVLLSQPPIPASNQIAVEVPSPIPEADTSDEGETQSTQADGKVSYKCPNCGYSNTANLPPARGSTAHTTCVNCRARVLLHRLAAGAIRVVDPAKKGAKPAVSKQRSLMQLFSPGPKPSVVAPVPTASMAPQVQDSFVCPRCQYHVRFSAPSDQRIVEKPCFSCLSVISFDRHDRVGALVSSKRPVYVDSIDAGSMTCLTCQKDFYPRIFKTPDGKRFVCCFSCNTIYLPTEYRKTAIERTCPTDGCNNAVTFKLAENDEETRQFCLNCMSRLLYRRTTDDVSVIEKLDVPQLTFEAFHAGGGVCPHCNSLASGKYTRNSRGQKLSICWNCKKVFELIERPDELSATAAE